MADVEQALQHVTIPNTREVVNQEFQLPKRAWENLIGSYNSTHKRKFPFTPIQCSSIIELAKMGVYPPSIFKAIATTTLYGRMRTAAIDMEERLEVLNTKDVLDADEFEEFQSLSRNPYRILMGDITKAEGLSELADWDNFNLRATQQPEIMMAKMRMKFRELFSEKNDSATNLNVQINVGGDWAEEL